MKKSRSKLWRHRLAFLFAPVVLLLGAPSALSTTVAVLTLEGAVSPATADYTVRGIRRAAEMGAGLVVLRIDTPGGLDKAMRAIVKEILSSPIPVASFVAPSGARAASAGTFILYASHIAAMAPGTNLGAATPVSIGFSPGGGTSKKRDKADEKSRGGKPEGKSADEEEEEPKDSMTKKVTNDAAAYIRSLAQLRGRNAEWGEKAVRQAVSLSATEAKKLNVIDILAPDVKGLLKQLNGRKITVQGVERVLATEGAATIEMEPDWRSRLLSVIADPSIALILMMVGIYGLVFEFSNPGFVLPGVAGAISLLLALFAFQLLPINFVGLGLILLGLAFIVAEAFLPSFGALGIGGAVALTIGSVILIEPGSAGYAVPLSFSVSVGLASAAIVFVIVFLAVKARNRPVVSGREDIIGAPGIVLGDMRTQGWARVRGENWRIISRGPLAQGQKIRVTHIDGLTLSVEPETEKTHGGTT